MTKSEREKKLRMVRLSLSVDEATWKDLRTAAERERPEGKGRASINALLNRLIAEYLVRQKGGKR